MGGYIFWGFVLIAVLIALIYYQGFTKVETAATGATTGSIGSFTGTPTYAKGTA